MKTILVPTDFSLSAQAAVQYAAALCQTTGAQLILLHTYHVPFTSDEAAPEPVQSLSPAKQQQKKLHRLRLTLEKEYGIGVRTYLIPGLAAEEIVEMAEAVEADLIVMGTQRPNGLLRTVLGSITTAVLSRVSVPLLVIPEGVAFAPPKEIVLATDFQPLPDTNPFRVMKELVVHFKSTIRVVHIFNSELAEVNAGNELTWEHALEDLEHRYEVVADHNPIHGLETYLDNHRPDWLVLLPHRYSLLEGIFHRSCTRHLALHATLPLLVLPKR